MKISGDHFEVLDKTADLLKDLSDYTRTIHDSMDMKEIGDSRKKLAESTVDAFVYCSLLRTHLSIMDGEWCSLLDERKQHIENQYKQEASVDSLDSFI